MVWLGVAWCNKMLHDVVWCDVLWFSGVNVKCKRIGFGVVRCDESVASCNLAVITHPIFRPSTIFSLKIFILPLSIFPFFTLTPSTFHLSPSIFHLLSFYTPSLIFPLSKLPSFHLPPSPGGPSSDNLSLLCLVRQATDRVREQ